MIMTGNARWAKSRAFFGAGVTGMFPKIYKKFMTSQNRFSILRSSKEKVTMSQRSNALAERLEKARLRAGVSA
jgi:hypothetical protein